MRTVHRRALIGLGILSITAIPMIASARHLQPAEGTTTTAAPAPSTVLTNATTPAAPLLKPSPRRSSRHQPARSLDANDPWDSTVSHAGAITTTAERAVAAPQPLDTTDPWGTEPAQPQPIHVPAPPAIQPRTPTPQNVADDALRQAIKAAVDAGDLERASKLLDVLREQRK